MATAQEQALALINTQLEAGKIDAGQYQELLAGISQFSGGEVAQPVAETEAAPTALSDKSRRAYITVEMSDDFTRGHIMLTKRSKNGFTRSFGVWAEDVASVMSGLSDQFEELPEDVRKDALESK
jgi:hypothetical protein